MTNTISVFLLALILLPGGSQALSISPYLFGQNHWMADDDEGRVGYLHQLWPKVQESGIEMVRIGGNGYEHRFPDNKKLSKMLDSIRGIGAEPLLQIPRYFTDEQAARVIKDFKYANGKGVRFYSIGNEPICQSHGPVDDVHEYMVRLSLAMKAADPTIKIFVFDACTFHEQAHADFCGGRLDITGKDENGNWIIDGFAFHNYPNGREFKRDDVIFSGPQAIRRQAETLIHMMDTANQKHNRAGQDQLMWALTEFNVTYVNPDREISGIGNPSFLGGQFIAEIFGICMQYGAFTANPWCINETDRIATDFGYLGLPSEFYPRSSYYHTQMMAQHMDGQFMTTSSNQRYVKTIGSQSTDSICLMVMNQSQQDDYDFDIFLDNKDRDSSKPLFVRADVGLDKIISGTIPNQTTLMVVLSKTGQVRKKYIYGLAHTLKYQPPEVQ